MLKIRPVGPQNDHSLKVDACKTASTLDDLTLKDSEITALLNSKQLDHLQADRHFLNSRGKLSFRGKEMPCEGCE